MPKPLVSVVIPVYRGAQLILESIQSALDQTWSEIEVIVVDDGSTDGTAAVVQAIADPRVRLIRQPNAGASSARNRGYQASHGEFVQFLDHDDVIHPHKIAIQVGRLLREGTDCIACGTWERFAHDPRDGRREPQPAWRDGAPIDWLLSVRGGGGMMPTGAWLAPRKIIEAAGPWNVTLPSSLDDDGEFYSRCVLASRRVLFCADAVLHYRDADGSNLRLARSEIDIKSLLLTQQLYEERFLAIENSERCRRTLAHGYAALLEMVYPAHPSHCADAFESIERLGGTFEPPGSKAFKVMVKLFGLRRALDLRHGLRRIFGRPLFGGLFTPRSSRLRSGAGSDR